MQVFKYKNMKVMPTDHFWDMFHEVKGTIARMSVTARYVLARDEPTNMVVCYCIALDNKNYPGSDIVEFLEFCSCVSLNVMIVMNL